MENLKKGKEKAESFLKKITEQDWESATKDDKGELLPAESLVDVIDWAIRFEAFAYLGHRNKELIQKFARDIRNVWNKWIEFQKTKKKKDKRIFWPTVPCGIIQNNQMKRFQMEMKGALLWLAPPECDIESHVAMFRVKESLGIGGFDKYFDEAKKMLSKLLLHSDIFANLLNCRIIWQIVRSPILRLDLKDYIKIVIPKLKEEIIGKEDAIKRDVEIIKAKGIDDKDLIQSFIYGCFDDYFWASVGFFLSLGNLGNELDNLSKKASLDLVDRQYNNGSFEEDILTTCLAASSIHLNDVDPSGSVCTHAVEWLLKQQNEDGSWTYSLSLPTSSLADDTLSTVIVLETIDLITNSKPLPLWSLEEKPLHYEKKQTRIQPISPFPTPSGTTWYDVSIKFLSDEAASLEARGKSEGRTFAEMGFMDCRSKGPDMLWLALKEFAKRSGEISWEIEGVPSRINNNLKSYIKDLRKRLKHLFKIEDDPFEPYRKVKAYKTKFKIEFIDNTRD